MKKVLSKVQLKWIHELNLKRPECIFTSTGPLLLSGNKKDTVNLKKHI